MPSKHLFRHLQWRWYPPFGFIPWVIWSHLNNLTCTWPATTPFAKLSTCSCIAFSRHFAIFHELIPAPFHYASFIFRSDPGNSSCSMSSNCLLLLGTIGLLLAMIDVSTFAVYTQFLLFMHILQTGNHVNTSTHVISVRWHHPHTDSNPMDK